MKRVLVIKASMVAVMTAMTMGVMGQKELPLYTSDFSTWSEITSAQGNEIGSSGSAQCKDGFVYTGKPVVTPSAGTICSNNSTNYLEFPEFNFISGGAIEATIDVGKNGKYFSVGAVSGNVGTVTYKIDNQPAAAKDLGTDGTSFRTGKNYGEYVVTASFTGSGKIKLKLNISGKCGELTWKSIKVFSGVGTIPYVLSPDYPNAGADGSETDAAFVITGQKGGTDVTKAVNLKGYNVSGDVTLSIVGKDAARFSLPQTTISGASLASGAIVPVDVTFSPSVKNGTSSALLKVTPSDAGAQSYYLKLTGATGSGTPEIVASTSTVNFWTSLIATTTQSIDVSGLNLTGPITMSINGANSDRFTLSQNTLSLAEASAGKSVKITFTGALEVGEIPVTLTLSSPGAADVNIPLVGVTEELKPTMYPLEFDVSPSGTAYIETNPSGKIFKRGTKVTVTVTLEKGYKIERWEDAAGSTRSSRIIVASESKNTQSGDPITVYTTKGQQNEGEEVVDVNNLVALKAENVTNNGFTATWTSQDGNTAGFAITIKDERGNVVNTLQAAAGATSIDVTGLEEDTVYYYTVTGTGTEGEVTTENVGGFKTTSTKVKTCGSDDYND